MLDPIHLVITYNQAFWKKKTSGESMLRVMMAKFNKVDLSRDISFWGEPYDGHCAVDFDFHDRYLWGQICTGGRCPMLSAKVLSAINPETPWLTVHDWLEAMASFASVYWTDIDRGTHHQGLKLYEVLWNAASPERSQWYFNNIRARRRMPTEYQSMLGSGTSPNEALNSQINRWFNNQPELYQATVDQRLYIMQTAKLIEHDLAIRYPQSRQMLPKTLLAASAACPLWSVPDWNAWTSAGYRRGSRLVDERGSGLVDVVNRPLDCMRQHHRALLTKKPSKQHVRRRICKKRPAKETLPLRMSTKVVKRTVFTIRRR